MNLWHDKRASAVDVKKTKMVLGSLEEQQQIFEVDSSRVILIVRREVAKGPCKQQVLLIMYIFDFGQLSYAHSRNTCSILLGRQYSC